jgi:REP element-mobilizing transposase RayT
MLMRQNSNAKPAPTNSSALTQSHGIPEIIRGFKTFSARGVNQRRKSPGSPVWQRNYYEHIIRNDQSWHFIREYIHNNPRSWWEDQLHPDNPSKW